MQIRERLIIAVMSILMLLPICAMAQSSSINTFSPYSFYGLGDISTLGTSGFRSMGGAGMAYRNTYLTPYTPAINTLNPASYSSIPQQSFMFNFELEGANYYLKDANTKSSYNSFNIREVAVLFPLGKRIGFGLSITPYSSVGYRLEEVLDDPDVIANIGDVRYKYEGDGDVNQLKVGIGMQLFKNFSLGVDMLYYFGDINRTHTLAITSITGGGGYTTTTGYLNDDISKIFADVGFQYNAIANLKRVLTIGGHYRMGGKLNPKKSHTIPAMDLIGSIVWHENAIDKNFKMADEFSLGMFYQTSKLAAGFDYTFANWGNSNDYKTYGVNYKNTNSIKAGMQYTPNRFDVRRFLSRLTYRVGVRYQQSYMEIQPTSNARGGKLDDKAVTLGFGIPLRVSSLSYLNLGLEYGQRGTTRGRMVKENYFKISLGISFFGEDYWFRKHKYD